MLSEDRKTEGLALTMSIADNLTLSHLDPLGPLGFIVPKLQRAAAKTWSNALAVKCRDVSQPIGDLSGGNQQKVAIARLLHHDVDILLLDEPTRGIDVGSKAAIYQLIDNLAAGDDRNPKSVIVVSSYFPELLGICDRIAVMARGILGPAKPVEQWTEHALVLAATGQDTPISENPRRRSHDLVPRPTSPALAEPAFSTKSFLLRWLDIIGPAIALVVIFLFFTALVPDWHSSDFQNPSTFLSQLHRFANFDNISNILRQSSMTAVASLGMTFIIIAGGIDLSAGSLAALSGVIIAVMLNKLSADIPLLQSHPTLWPLIAALTGLLFGLLAGLLNGRLITGLRIVPFIITLGTMMILRGSAKGFANESNVPTSSNWLYALLAPPSDSMKWMLFPPAIWITIFLAILMAVILNYSRFGRHVIAVGSNEQTARLCGIPVNRTKLFVYTLGGLFAGFAGLFFYSRIRQGSPTSADAFELDVIAAVVIGGASLSGGKGSIFGSLVGALILNVIARGCSQIHIPTFAQHFVGSDHWPPYLHPANRHRNHHHHRRPPRPPPPTPPVTPPADSLAPHPGVPRVCVPAAPCLMCPHDPIAPLPPRFVIQSFKHSNLIRHSSFVIRASPPLPPLLTVHKTFPNSNLLTSPNLLKS